MLRCSDDSLYTGVTTDLQRREAEHNAPGSSTRYTRVRQPVRLVYAEGLANRSQACRRERQIKALTRSGKENLLGLEQNLLLGKR